jgi:hypothetical protein
VGLDQAQKAYFGPEACVTKRRYALATGVFLIRDNDELVEMTEEPYDSEDAAGY